jgi:hypothetical protein
VWTLIILLPSLVIDYHLSLHLVVEGLLNKIVNFRALLAILERLQGSIMSRVVSSFLTSLW